jgi:hypothetical protein
MARAVEEVGVAPPHELARRVAESGRHEEGRAALEDQERGRARLLGSSERASPSVILEHLGRPLDGVRPAQGEARVALAAFHTRCAGQSAPRRTLR